MSNTHVLINTGMALHIIHIPAEGWYGRTKCGLLYSEDEPTDRYLWGKVMHTGYVEYDLSHNPPDVECGNCARAHYR